MNALGIIFSNIHDRSVPELTQNRAMGSVQFGGKYRLIDFPLSCMVNAGITNVGVITKTNYHSLMEHLGSGKDWDLARKEGGLTILPPFNTTRQGGLYTNRLEALVGVMDYIKNATEEYVVLADTDAICNVDLADVLKYHEDNRAAITTVYKKVRLTGSENTNHTLLRVNDKNIVTDIGVYDNAAGEKNIDLNIWVMKCSLLQTIVADAAAHGHTSLSRDVIAPNLELFRVLAYEYKGPMLQIESLSSYLSANLAILDKSVRDGIFASPAGPILTRVHDSAPTKYGKDAKVVNSMIADNCIIEGTVENCIISRGVKIGEGAVVRNCVLNDDTYIGDGVSLDSVIADKNVVVRNGRTLAGHISHPFYLSKGSLV